MLKSYKSVWINGKQIRLHRYIMMLYLDRELDSNELVHHKNGNIHDNRIENLEILSNSAHMKLHQKLFPFGKRFEQKYHIDPNVVFEFFKQTGMEEISKIFGCSIGTIQNIIKDNNLRSKIVCKICGEYARYRKSQLCRKHYLQQWYQKSKILKT